MPNPLTPKRLREWNAYLRHFSATDRPLKPCTTSELLSLVNAAEERDRLKTALDQTRALWQAETKVSAEWCAKATVAQKEVERLRARVRELEAPQ